MKERFLPKTKLGKWSVVLILLMFFLFRVGILVTKNYYPSVSAGETILEDIIARPAVSMPMLTGFASGILAFIAGVISIFKKGHEKAIAVFASTTIGLLLLLFLLAEILSPH